MFNAISPDKVLLGDLIDEGAYGKVYKGSWNNQMVAVKKLNTSSISKRSNLLESYRAEAKLLSKCKSPNIVAIYGACLEPGNYQLILEFCDKGSLFSLLHNNLFSLSWGAKRWKYVMDAAKGLLYLHTMGIIHADLKTENILINENDEAKIADLGLAFEATSDQSDKKIVKGTLRWMAPELFEHDAVPTLQSDIHSFGMVLWEIVTRQFPYKLYDDETAVDVIKKNIHETIPNSVFCPPKFQKIIEECWETPLNRPSAQIVLERLIEAEAIEFFEDIPESEYVNRAFILGRNYEGYYGHPIDHTKSACWYKKAADQGHEEAKKNLAELQNKVSIEDVVSRTYFGSSIQVSNCNDNGSVLEITSSISKGLDL